MSVEARTEWREWPTHWHILTRDLSKDGGNRDHRDVPSLSFRLGSSIRSGTGLTGVARQCRGYAAVQTDTVTTSL